MIRKIIPLAFKFRNAKMWEFLSDHDIYAVQLRDGRIGYCSVMGRSGMHFSLGLFIGQRSWNTYVDMYEGAQNGGDPSQLMYETDCINCDFMDKSDISPSKAKTRILAYARAHGIRTTGIDAVPDFVRHTPYHQPWVLTDQSDADALEDALRASLFLSEYLDTNSLESAGFIYGGIYALSYEGDEIPFLVPDGDTWVIKSTTLPDRIKKTYPAPTFDYPELITEISLLESKSSLECGFYLLPTPIKDAEIPYIPVATLMVNPKEGTMIFTKDEAVTEEMPNSQIVEFAQKVILFGYRPKTISVPDSRTFELLKDFCLKTKIKLKCTDNLKLLPRVWLSYCSMLGY